MEGEWKIRFLVEQLQWKVYERCSFKDEKFPVSSKGDITENLVDLLADVIWTRMVVDGIVWTKYVTQFSRAKHLSAVFYGRYILYACYKINNTTRGIYERFINVCTTVFCISFLFKDKFNSFLQYTPYVLTTFLEWGFEGIFKKRGGFKALETYLEKKEYKKKCHELKTIMRTKYDHSTIGTLTMFNYVEKYKTRFNFSPDTITFDEVEKNKVCSFLADEALNLAEENGVSQAPSAKFSGFKKQTPSDAEKFAIQNSAGETRNLLSYNGGSKYNLEVLPDTKPATLASMEIKSKQLFSFCMNATIDTEGIMNQCSDKLKGRCDVLQAIAVTNMNSAKKIFELCHLFEYIRRRV
ncbi:hypothetical protein CDAR_374121 [Caerostris darwini]|uniref:LAGLIDADG homing endonuclease n=1 Tax=Caerostris darwini TaxID=1538125 RepID=A0AAV4P1Y3_9ARAC|nr:hypothetical protein CDAR_374121 [Caerostris darwini]